MIMRRDFYISESKPLYKTHIECINCGNDFFDNLPKVTEGDYLSRQKRYKGCPNCFYVGTLEIISQDEKPVHTTSKRHATAR